MRKLATIQRISAVNPILGADNIECVEMAGNAWRVVVKKGDFAVGDLCVYFEIDSFLLASDPRYAFAKDRFITWDGKEGMRLKTIKLRKQISQGLVLPVRDFGELPAKLAEGDDVTETLKVEKWEPAEEVEAIRGGPAQQRSRDKPWPFFLQKSDQERVQNLLPQIARSSALLETFEKTLKLDGSSMTVYALSPDSAYYAEAESRRRKKLTERMGFWKRLVFEVKSLFTEDTPSVIYGVCSRNIELDLEGNSHFAQYVRDNNVIEKLAESLGEDESFAFQGELIAPSIQGNYEKVDKFEWYVYDVFAIDAQAYLIPSEARYMTDTSGLTYVPILDKEAVLPAADTPGEIAAAILSDAEGPGMNPGVKREGVVYKSNSTAFSFKGISDSYLLKKG